MNMALFPDLVVNGETVPHTVIAAEAQNHAAPKGKPGIAWRKAANAVAVRTLIVQEARRRDIQPCKMKVGPDRFETEEEAMIRGLLETEVAVDPPTLKAVRAEWARDPQRFRAPPLWEVSHILVSCDPRNEAQQKAAFTHAVEVTARALEMPNAFADLAAKTSDCGSKASGGALGQLGPGDTVPEFERALGHLSAGEITDRPVLSRYGWHIIRMDAVAEGAVLPFEAVQGKISEAMEKTAWARKARNFVNELVASAEISGAELHPD